MVFLHEVLFLKLLKSQNFFFNKQLEAGVNQDEDGFKLWQSLVRQTELTAQLCSIMRDVRNVRGGTQKKIEKLRQLLSGLLSELTYFDEVAVFASRFTLLLIRVGCEPVISFSLVYCSVSSIDKFSVLYCC